QLLFQDRDVAVLAVFGHRNPPRRPPEPSDYDDEPWAAQGASITLISSSGGAGGLSRKPLLCLLRRYPDFIRATWKLLVARMKCGIVQPPVARMKCGVQSARELL